MKPAPAEASPAKSLVQELHFLRQRLRELVKAYGHELDAGLAHVSEAVATEGKTGKTTAVRLRDFRDMLGLLRTLEIKPEKGRRRDLKKIEATAAELQRFLETW